MKERKLGSTAYPISFLLVSKVDHITGVTGKVATINLTISKDASNTFIPHDATSAIGEIGFGWYSWSASAVDRDTLGELKIHVAEASCDPYDEKYDIVQYDPFAAVSLPAAERIALADTILTRDWVQTAAAIVTIPARCLLQGMRLLRNKWAIDPPTGILIVRTEDDNTEAWRMQTQSQQGADPIVGQIPTS